MRKKKLLRSYLMTYFAHQDALQTALVENKLLLLKQREKGHPGWMGGVIFNFIKAEERRQKRHASKMTNLA